MCKAWSVSYYLPLFTQEVETIVKASVVTPGTGGQIQMVVGILHESSPPVQTVPQAQEQISEFITRAVMKRDARSFLKFKDILYLRMNSV